MDPFADDTFEMDEAPVGLLKYSTSSVGVRPSMTGNGLMRASALLSITSYRRRWEPVMKFESPIIEAATLPGPLYYMKVRRPGMEKPMAIQECLPHQGHTLITDKDDNYFRVHLTVLHIVDAVTCLSHNEFCTEIISQLYGRHEAFFNKLLHKYLTNRIDDFYDFFTQPWMSVLYQENFRDLLEAINHQDIGTLYDLVNSTSTPYKEESQDDMTKSTNSTETFESMSLDKTIEKILNSSSSLNLRKERRQIGTFRSLLEKFFSNRSAFEVGFDPATSDIPSECGHSEQIRSEAQKFWERVDGELIVTSHLASYLKKNFVHNPQYCMPSNKWS